MSSNDPAHPQLDLKVSGRVDVAVAFQPTFVDLGRVEANTNRYAVTPLIGRLAADAHLGSISTTDPNRLAVTDVSQPGAPALQVVFRSDRPGIWNGQVMAATGLKAPPVITLNVRAEVLADLVAEPAEIVFGKEDQPTATVKVRSLSRRPFDLIGVGDTSGAVTGRIEPGDGTREVILAVAHPGPVAGVARIRTDREDQPTIDVRWSTKRLPDLGVGVSGKVPVPKIR